jgi:hypothetical protein
MTTKYYVIFGNHGTGWEAEDYFEDYSEAKRCLGEYRMIGTYAMQTRYVRDGKDPLNCRYRYN